MATIFEAEHTATERRVALKLLFPHIMSVASARKKFELEARISARVNSPFIVEVLDAGFDEPSKSPFLVMELLEGQTLAAHIYEHGPLAPREAIRLLQQVAAGLDAAHAYRDPDGTPKPIVHRDLKPENLFLARTHDGRVSAKILDYGIAKMLGDTSSLSQEVRGTPLFMAFEQITLGSLSAQTDVWAFGLIAFYMLAGMQYWRSAEREGISVQSLFAEILTLPLALPSVRLWERGSGIELPLSFDTWLLRCINRDPSQRFPTVTAAVQALGHVFDVELEDFRPPCVRLLTSAEKAQSITGAPLVAEDSSAGSLPVMTAARSGPARPLRVPPISTWQGVAAGALAGSLLGVIAWGLTAPSATAVPAREPSSITAAGPAGPHTRAQTQSAAGSPSGGISPTETAARLLPLEAAGPHDERGSVGAERSPNGASDRASAAAAIGERRVEALEVPAPSPGDPSSTDSRADSRDEDAKQSTAGESSDGSRHPRAASSEGKPAGLKLQMRPRSSEAYRVR